MTTLSDLKTRVRQRADMENSAYIGDTELASYINASYAELYDIVVNSYEDYYVTGPTAFSLTTSDAGVYALPSTLYKLKGVDYSLGGDWVPLEPYKWNERGQSRGAFVRGATLRDRSYRMVGANLRMEPADNAVGSYQIWYVPAYTALSADASVVDTLMTRNNWEEYIVIDAAIKCLAKEESNTAHLVEAKEAIRRRIVASASERDADAPESITDVRGRRLW